MRMNELTPSIVTESNRLLAGKWKSCLGLFSAEQSLEPRRANSTRRDLKREKRHEEILRRPCVTTDPSGNNRGPQSDCKLWINFMLLKCWSNSWVSRKEKPSYFPMQSLGDGFPADRTPADGVNEHMLTYGRKTHGKLFLSYMNLLGAARRRCFRKAEVCSEETGGWQKASLFAIAPLQPPLPPPGSLWLHLALQVHQHIVFPSAAKRDTHTHTNHVECKDLAKTNKLSSCSIVSIVCSSLRSGRRRRHTTPASCPGW